MDGVPWLQAESEQWIRDIVAGFLSEFAGVNECEVAEVPELSRAAAFVDAGCHGELLHGFGTGLIAQPKQQLLLLGGQVVQFSEAGGGECIESLFQQRCEFSECAGGECLCEQNPGARVSRQQQISSLQASEAGGRVQDLQGIFAFSQSTDTQHQLPGRGQLQ